MSSPAVRPLIIVSLPGRTIDELRAQAVTAARLGADAAEIRFDRLDNADLSTFSALFPTPLPLVATLRSRSEGGAGPDTVGDRSAWREAVRGLPFAWIDLEIGRDPIPAGTYASGPRPIASRHLLPGDPLAGIGELLDTAAPPGGFVKIVAPASVRDALEVVLPATLAHPPKGDRCVMTTGASGPLVRAWAASLGSCAVYCSLDLPASPGTVEPAQIPVARFRRWADGPPSAPLFAVVGSPIAHSLSPALHSLWMAEEGHDGLYITIDIPEGKELTDAVAVLGRRGVRGMSVTHPLKDAAFGLATQRTPAADQVGCANTLTLQGSDVIADNTDLAAVQTRMAELRSSYPGILRHVLIVGTGGAARAALGAARNLGIRPELLGRDPRRAADLAARFGADVAPHPSPGAATLVVQATTVGRSGSSAFEVPLDEWIDSRTHLLDFVYAPDHPTVSDLAHLHAGRYEDGRRLLAYAAAASYGDWWGSPPSPGLIEQALREIL